MYHQEYSRAISDENSQSSWRNQKPQLRGPIGDSPALLPQQHSRLPPMSPMVANRRSLSRALSVGRGDETPLGSPMPMYPRGRRSVTFVDDEERGVSGLREERPDYHTLTADSAVKAPQLRMEEPYRPHDDHQFSYEEHSDSRVGGAAPPSIMVRNDRSTASSQQRGPSHYANRSLPQTPRKVLMTPTRRSASRQRLESRREQAMLDHTFYDDSFIEDFVVSARDELERKLQEERQAAEAKLEAERRVAAEEAAQLRAAAEREREKAVAAAQEAAQISMLSSISSHQSTRQHNFSGEDSRALLARLRQELATSDKPYIEMTPRKSQRNSIAPTTLAAALVADVVGSAKKKAAARGNDSRAASIMIHYPSASENEQTDGYDDVEEMPQRQQRTKRQPAPKSAAPSSTRARAESAGTKKKTERIESLIREAMTNYRKNKKAGSVMVIDLDNLGDGASESEAPTPQEPKRTRAASRVAAPPPKAKSAARVIQLDEPVVIQRGAAKRGRAAEDVPVAHRVASARRMDSRPRFDDDSSGGDHQPDDNDDDVMSDDDRPILLHRTSKVLQGKKTAGGNDRQSSHRMEAEVESILSMGGRHNAAAPKTLPRAPPPPRPAARGGARGRKKDVASEDDMEPLPVQRAMPFAAPYVEPTLTRSAVARSAAAQPPASLRQQKQSKASLGDAFAQFEFQFDSPAKFDEPAPSSRTVGAVVKATRQNNGGLMLASSCRSRRR